jgi:hypothetical protein
MKTKLFFSVLLSFVFCLLSSQVPQGLNYQAIARDGSGTILANQALPVKIAVMDALTGGNVVYEESFPSISSNQFGLITLIVGTGTPLTGTFSAIDWKSKTLYLRTKIEYPSGTWVEMGTSPIMSVPYSLVAKEVTGPLTKLGIESSTTNMEEALFEVKNKAGNTVFAVYNEGIRAYVGNGNTKGAKGGFSVGGYDATKGAPYDLFVLNTDSARFYIDSKPHLKGARGGFAVGGYDMTKGVTLHDYLDVSKDSVRIYVDSHPLTKGVRGGFSVGGYDMTKGGLPIQDYMHVSKDSVRVYVDSNPATKGVRGGFAVGGYDMTKGGSPISDFLNIETNTSGIINPSEPRILWYPIKNAFLVGQVLIHYKDSIGLNSTTTGFESRAKGNWSQAMGYQAIARGLYSTAIGKNAFAGKDNSFAFGDNVYAGNASSYAFGRKSRSTGSNSYAFGDSVIANNSHTYAFGRKAIASGNGGFAFGYNAIASGQDAFAFGTGAEASAIGSFALGFIGRDSAGVSTGNTKATVDYAIAIGMGAQATKKGAFSIGLQSVANGEYSLAMGYKSSASNYYSVSIGNAATSSGFSSFAAGWLSKATSTGSVALGINASAGAANSVAIGPATTASSTSSVALGYGSKATSSNAMALAGGTASGIQSIAGGYKVKSSGNYSVALGYQTKGYGTYSGAFGYKTNAKPFASFAIGYNNDTTVNNATGWYISDPLFMVGNGYYGTATNALTVFKNGNAYIQGSLGIGAAPGASPKLHVAGDAYVTGLLTIDGNIGMGGSISASGTFTGSGVTIGSIPITTSSGRLTITGSAFITATDPKLFIGGTAYDVGALNVERWNAPVAMFNRRSNNDGTIISFYQGDAGLGNPEIGTISVNAHNVSYNAFTGSHYGISDEKIEEGKLVAMNGINSRFGNMEGFEMLYGISESSKANDPAAMGAYFGILESTKPYGNTNPYLIMAEGNGEMWVVDNGENLNPGDMLISSDIKGHAMKDKGQYAESYVVAKVAEPIDWQNVTETFDGTKHYKVSVLFTSFVRNNSIANQSAEVDALKEKVDKLEKLVEQLTEEKK